MATDNIEICNKALRSIGASALSSGMSDITSDTPVTKEDTYCSLYYADILEELLSLFDWNFARKRFNIESSDMEIDIAALSQADPGVVGTDTVHGYLSGDSVYIYDVGGMTDVNGNYYIVEYVDTVQFSLKDTLGADVNTGFYDAYTSGGTVIAKPAFGYEYAYKKPTDFLVDRTLNEEANWEIEGRYIITDQSEINMVYTSLITNVALFPIHFEKALVAMLAYELAVGLTQNASILSAAENNRSTNLSNSLLIDALQGLRKKNKKKNIKGTWADKRK